MISRTMTKKSRILQIAFTLTGIGIAFWVGRISTPDQTGTGESIKASEKSGPRSSRRLTGNRQSLGAGEEAITSSSRLRELFKRGDSTKATLALAKMNSDELSSLAQDLATTCADMPTYMVYTEMNAVFGQWVESDVDAALKFALSSTQNSFKSQATRSIFQKLAKMDPDLARVKLADIPDNALRWKLKRTLYQSLAVSQPDVWLQEIRSDAALSQRTHMPSIAAHWAMEDPVAAAARIQQLPLKFQMDGVASIGKTWAAKDPQAAMAWAQTLPQSNVKNKAICAVIGGMAAKNPDAAMAALDNISPSSRRAGISAIFQTLVNSDFDGALAKASGLTDPRDQKMAYEEMLSRSNNNSRLNVEQITALTKTLTGGSIRKRALHQLGFMLVYHEPKDTESLLKAYSEKEQVTIQLQMLNGLSQTDPRRAMEIYQSLPSNKVDNRVFSNIVRQISKNDPNTALEWVLKEKSSYKQVNNYVYAGNKKVYKSNFNNAMTTKSAVNTVGKHDVKKAWCPKLAREIDVKVYQFADIPKWLKGRTAFSFPFGGHVIQSVVDQGLKPVTKVIEFPKDEILELDDSFENDPDYKLSEKDAEYMRWINEQMLEEEEEVEPADSKELEFLEDIVKVFDQIPTDYFDMSNPMQACGQFMVYYQKVGTYYPVYMSVATACSAVCKKYGKECLWSDIWELVKINGDI